MSKGKKILISIVCVVLLLGLGAMMFYFHQGLWLPKPGEHYRIVLSPKNEQELEIMMGSEFLYSQTGKANEFWAGGEKGVEINHNVGEPKFLEKLVYASWRDVFDNNLINMSVYKNVSGSANFDCIEEEFSVITSIDTSFAGYSGKKAVLNYKKEGYQVKYNNTYITTLGFAFKVDSVLYLVMVGYPEVRPTEANYEIALAFAPYFSTIENYIAQLA